MSVEIQILHRANPDFPVIDQLKPRSPLHQQTLTLLLNRLRLSEQAMRNFYSRWEINEMKTQVYISLPEWEKELKELKNNKGAPAAPTRMTAPYTFATINTIVTYLVHTFMGQRPMFQVGSYNTDQTEAATMLETVLQYHADHSRLTKQLFQFLYDGQLYGLSILRTRWKEDYKLRTVRKQVPSGGFISAMLGKIGLQQPMESVASREERLVYAGNEIFSVDPFMFFPDPNVPMNEVNRRGEWVSWRTFNSKSSAKAAEQAGDWKWVDDAGQLPQDARSFSARGLKANGQANPAQWRGGENTNVLGYNQEDQGSYIIIPSEWGLGESNKPEKWLFTILNKTQIVQAERLDLDHDMHPVVVSEPYTMGYGFGHAGIADYLGDIQDVLSWFTNSHIENVRTAINNMFVVDPSVIEMQDLKEPGAGKIIRLKKKFYGTDIRSALYQLPVHDVTQSHMGDFGTFMKIGDVMASVNDNLRGVQTQGSRRSATEARQSTEASASRLGALARFISAQAIVDLTEQMSLNTQQFLEDEFYIQVVGMQGLTKPIKISPDQISGDFYFPVHDGTLPIDRVAMIDVWKELFLAIKGDPLLSQRFSVVDIFSYIAQLSGANNIDRFKLNLQPNQEVDTQAKAGNMIPVQQALASGMIPSPSGGTTPGVIPSPGDRMAGG